jgi:RNA polymerase sigma factor for flagellar operon FliA
MWADFFREPESGPVLCRLVEALLPLVNRVIERTTVHLPSHIAIEDLFQSGTMGLYQAILRFNPELGLRFDAFAYPRIRGAILDELRAMDHLSRSCRSHLKKMESVIAKWTQERGMSPTEEELAREMGMTPSELSAMLDRAGPLLSMDDVIVRNGDRLVALREILADPKTDSPEEALERDEMWKHLRSAFLRLSPREQKILYLYYFEELRLSEIGVLYDLTESRICQIHSLALTRLKAYLRGLDME